jgi:hypothetical protein
MNGYTFPDGERHAEGCRCGRCRDADYFARTLGPGVRCPAMVVDGSRKCRALLERWELRAGHIYCRAHRADPERGEAAARERKRKRQEPIEELRKRLDPGPLE